MPWHSKDNSSGVYHVCHNCPHSQRIKPDNRRPGRNNRRLCEVCQMQLDGDACRRDEG